MLELEEARRLMLASINPLPAESIPLGAACGRILASDVFSPLDLPAFANSAMDGYAARAVDLAGGGPEQPVRLRLIGRVTTGDSPREPLPPGTCVRIFTGSALPGGADTVVMQEDTRTDPAQPGHVLFCDGGRPWDNVRLQGEDVKRGALLVSAGERLNAGRVGLLAAAGLCEVRASRQPVIGLLATGSELVEAGLPLSPGRIYESNRLTLAPLIVRSGSVPKIFPIVADSLAATTRALQQAFADCDAVVTTGGVSVGESDFTRPAFEALGGELEFWKVSMKPGKPFAFGHWQGRWLFGLPGNPVSAVVTFLLLVRPALWRLQRAAMVEPPSCSAILAEPLANRGDRRHFMRVHVDDTGAARSAGIQGSHRLTSLARATALVDVPPRTTLAAGTSVRVVVLDD